MNIINKGFGEQLKQYRKLRNITQEKFSEKIGINLRQLARIEAGESFVSAETLLKICIILEISPSKLFDFNIIQNMSLKSIDVENDDIKNFLSLKNKLFNIAKDKKKIEFLNIAYDALTNPKALKELKAMIKGIELTK